MPFLSCLEHWLSLATQCEDEALLLEAWHAVSPHLFRDLVRILQARETGRLERIWEELAQDDARLFLEYLCSKSGAWRCSAPADRVESALLLRTLQRRIAGAGIAAALLAPDIALLTRWLHRLDLETPTLPTSLFSSPASALPALFQALRSTGALCGEIEDWTACLLRPLTCSASHALASRTPIAARRCPVLIQRPDRTGLVGWLTLEVLDAGGAEIFPDTRAMGLAPLSHSFRAALALAHDNVRRRCRNISPTVRWRIQSDLESWEGRQMLEGGSHGAAFAVGLIQLLGCEPLDAGTALTMTLDAQGEFGPVAGVYAKVQAACALRDGEGRGQIQRVAVHPENAYEAQAAAVGAGRDPEKTILVYNALDGFLPEASGPQWEQKRAMAREEAEREAEAQWRTLGYAAENGRASQPQHASRNAARRGYPCGERRERAHVGRRGAVPAAGGATYRCCRLP